MLFHAYGASANDGRSKRQALQDFQLEAELVSGYGVQDYGYAEPVEVDALQNEAQHETGEEQIATAPEHGVMTAVLGMVLSSVLPSAENLLVYGTTEAEDDTGLEVEEEPVWDPPAVRRHKVRCQVSESTWSSPRNLTQAEIEMRTRLGSVESKLDSIKKLLSQLLHGQGAPTTPAGGTASKTAPVGSKQSQSVASTIRAQNTESADHITDTHTTGAAEAEEGGEHTTSRTTEAQPEQGRSNEEHEGGERPGDDGGPENLSIDSPEDGPNDHVRREEEQGQYISSVYTGQLD